MVFLSRTCFAVGKTSGSDIGRVSHHEIMLKEALDGLSVIFMCLPLGCMIKRDKSNPRVMLFLFRMFVKCYFFKTFGGK